MGEGVYEFVAFELCKSLSPIIRFYQPEKVLVQSTLNRLIGLYEQYHNVVITEGQLYEEIYPFTITFIDLSKKEV